MYRLKKQSKQFTIFLLMLTCTLFISCFEKKNDFIVKIHPNGVEENVITGTIVDYRWIEDKNNEGIIYIATSFRAYKEFFLDTGKTIKDFSAPISRAKRRYREESEN